MEQEEIERRRENVNGIAIGKHVGFKKTPIPILLVLYRPFHRIQSPEYTASIYCFNSHNNSFAEKSSSVNNGSEMGIEGMSKRLNTN